MKTFTNIKEEADSVGLIKIIEQICYNYQPHEYPPLVAWEAFDMLGHIIVALPETRETSIEDALLSSRLLFDFGGRMSGAPGGGQDRNNGDPQVSRINMLSASTPASGPHPTSSLENRNGLPFPSFW